MQTTLDHRLKPHAPFCGALMAGAILIGTSVNGHALEAAGSANATLRELAGKLQIGDVVFIRIPRAPFTKVASTTSSWTNHVGIVSDLSGNEPVISESRVPFAGDTSWSRFVGRSDNGRVALARLGQQLDQGQQARLRQAVEARQGILYDTGFDLHSKRQFC